MAGGSFGWPPASAGGSKLTISLASIALQSLGWRIGDQRRLAYLCAYGRAIGDKRIHPPQARAQIEDHSVEPTGLGKVIVAPRAIPRPP